MRSEKMVSRSLSVCGVPYIRLLLPPRVPADMTKELMWSRCACVRRKHLISISMSSKFFFHDVAGRNSGLT